MDTETTTDIRFEGISDLDVIKLGFICANSAIPGDIEFATAARAEINRRAKVRRLVLES